MSNQEPTHPQRRTKTPHAPAQSSLSAAQQACETRCVGDHTYPPTNHWTYDPGEQPIDLPSTKRQCSPARRDCHVLLLPGLLYAHTSVFEGIRIYT